MPLAASPPDMAWGCWIDPTGLTTKGQNIWIKGRLIDEVLEKEVGAILNVSGKFLDDFKPAVRYTYYWNDPMPLFPA
jgi:hypothetical protein